MSESSREYFNYLLEEIKLTDVLEKLQHKIKYRGGDKPITICPFHVDNNPSLVVYENQFHCFSCGAHGNIFTIIMHERKCNFSEAIKWIEDNFPSVKKNNASLIIKNNLKSGFEVAFDCYKNMNKFEANEFSKFTKNRGYTVEFLKQSEVFFARGRKLLEENKNDIVFQSLLTEKNLLKEKASENMNDKVYDDVFKKDKAVITLRSKDNEIVGFAGRAIDDINDKPKYLFTKDLPKGRMLYGLNRVKEKCFKELESDIFELYITEGTFDALRLESLGFNAVSVLGSHITVEQVRVLTEFIDYIKPQYNKRQSYNSIIIHIFLDSDSAGLAGTFKSIRNLWLDKITRGVYIDVIINKKSFNNEEVDKKDPDSIFKNKDLNESKVWLNENNIDVFEFLMRYLLDSEKLIYNQAEHNNTFDKYYSEMKINDRISLLNRLNVLVPNKYWDEIIRYYALVKNITIDTSIESFNIKNIQSLGIPNYKSQEDSTIYDISNEILFHRAIQIAKKSYTKEEVTYDKFTWDRIESCADAFNIYFKEKLKKCENLNMPMTAFNVPKKINEFRLKTLFSHEQLIMQQYMLNEILSSDINYDYERSIPAVRYSKSRKGSEIYTTGLDIIDTYEESNEKAVSFAYQIDMDVVNGDIQSNYGMFRNYFDCWKSFIYFIREGIEKIQGDKIYKIRLDICKFYDNISIRAVRNVLYSQLNQAISASHNKFKIIESEDKAKEIFDWITKEIFNYKYINPENGRVSYSEYSSVGIPQGPNLSAYLANIVLFPLDKAVTEYIESTNDKRFSVRYGRYVDDMIIVSDNQSHINDIIDIINSELYNIGLELGNKTKLGKLGNKNEAYEWLDENGGLSSSVISDYLEDIVYETEDFETLDRQDELRLLQRLTNKSLAFNKNKKEVETIIRNFYKTNDVRYNDIVRLIETLLIYLVDENKLNIKWFNDFWNDAVKLSQQDSMFRREDIKYLSLIDSILKICRKKENFSMNVEVIQNIKKYREAVIKFYEESDLESIILSELKNNTLLKENETAIKFKFLEIMKYQIDNKNSLNQIKDAISKFSNDYITGKNIYYLRWMYQIEHSLKNIGISTNIMEHFSSMMSENSQVQDLEIFHWAITGIITSKTEDEYMKIENLFKNFAGSEHINNSIFSKCISAWFLESNLGIVERNVILITLISILNNSISAYVLNKKKYLKEYLFNEKSINYLPIPPGVEYPGIIAKKDKNIKRIDFKQYSSNLSDLMWEKESLSHLTENLEFDVKYSKYKAELTSDFEEIGEYLTRFKNEEGYFEANIINEVIEIYIKLYEIIRNLEYYDSKVDNKELIVSKYHTFINPKKEIKIVSYKVNNDTTNSRVATSRGVNLLEIIDVPSNGDHYWKAGHILYDALNFKDIILSKNQDDKESTMQMLYYSFLRLKGEWFKTNNNLKTIKSYERTVEKTLTELRAFANTENKRVFLVNCKILNNFINFRISKEYFKVGEFEYQLSNWAKQYLIDEFNYIEMNELLKKYQYEVTDLILEACTRIAPLSYFILGSKIKNIKEDMHELDALNVYAIGMFIKSVSVNIRTQVLERILALSNKEAQSFMNREFPLEFLKIEEEKIKLVQDYEYDIIVLKDITSNLLEKNHDDRIISITPIGWLVLLCWLLEIDEPSHYIIHKHTKKYSSSNNKQSTELKNSILILRDKLLFNENQINNELNEHYPFNDIYGMIDEWTEENVMSIFVILKLIDEFDDVKVDRRASDIFTYNRVDNNKIVMNVEYKRIGKKPKFFLTNEKVDKFDTMNSSMARWSQTIINNEIVGINFIGDKFKNLIKLKDSIFHVDDNNRTIKQSRRTSIKELEFHKESVPDIYEENNETQNITEVKEENKINIEMQVSAPEKESNGECCCESNFNMDSFKTIVTNFKKAQRDNWKRRKGHAKSLNRIAFLQFEVDDSYRHPIVEMCLDNESALKCKKSPEKWEAQDIKGTKSCSEFRRKKILADVFEACDNFGVDILLLPEYSVRPETVNWMCKLISEESYNFSVWAGTHRLVPNRNLQAENIYKSEKESENLDEKIYDWAAVLPIVTKIEDNNKTLKTQIIMKKFKKYPALALQEVINPLPALQGKTKPFMSTIKSIAGDKLFFDARDDVMELICAEMFMVNSPSNIMSFAKASFDLKRRFSSVKHKDNEGFEDYIQSTIVDITNFGKSTSIYQQENKYGRTPILLVPAYTTRAVDYYLAGQSSYLSSGLTTVFCNAVGLNTTGGSCFIGTNSWDNYKIESDIFMPDYSLYHGVTPGVYRQYLKEKDRGGLGSKEQALVICDVNPCISFRGNPNPESFGEPLELVAHLPIIESNITLDKDEFLLKKKNEKFAKEPFSFICRCKKSEKRVFWHNDCKKCPDISSCRKTDNVLYGIMELADHIFGMEEHTEIDGCLNTLLDCNPEKIKDALMVIGKEINSEWLIKRGKKYAEQHINNPQSWPPPTAIDWIWVDVNYEDGYDANYLNEEYKIDVPKFATNQVEHNLIKE